MSWSRARVLAEPEMVTDMARISAVEATTTKIRRVDEQKKAATSKKKKMASASFLRQPGKGTEMEESDEDKMRFAEPLAQLMNDCKVGRSENASATDEEILNSLRRKAKRVVKAAEIPTLHRAITTADEVRKYLASRETHMGVDKVEPIVLEEFLWQSRARVRAVNAIAWMCKNLQLGWPIDKVEKPDIKKASLIGMECKQAPAAQPGMLKALSDTMEVGAESGDPTWLALLASWLQAMANLRLVPVLRRSVPVELFAGWMLFFCTRGKQQHNRAEFYWGVPSVTATNYDWTYKFLEEYNLRRQSDMGKEMMGMIFRTDTYEYLSSRAVNALTMNAVAGVVENPELLTTYSWRRMLPTIALHLNFSPAERLAIGDWKDAKEMGNEAPITLRYAEGKEGKSRVCKLICAAALASLATMDTQTFDEIPAQQWETLAKEARAEVGSETQEVNAKWRNPDVAESGGGFKVKKSQKDSLKQLARVPLAPECKNTKRHASPEEVNPEEGPTLKKVKMEEQDDHGGAEQPKVTLKPSSKALARGKPGVMTKEVSRPKHIEDDSIMQKLLPKLRGERDEVRGNRLNPESPRMVAKVCEEEGKGELWLGPLPTAQRMDQIKEVEYSIQIHCFLKDPTEVQMEPGGAKGAFIPGTCSVRCELSNPSTRQADMRALKAMLVNSLRQGDNAYVHCVSGISRAPAAAAVMCSMLMGISLEQSKDIIAQTRNVSFDWGEQHMQGAWVDNVLREKVTNAVVPTGFSCRVVNPEDVVVHATTSVKGGIEPICHWKKGAAGKHDFRGNIITVDSIEQASNQFSGRFCINCEALLRASLKLQVDQFYG